MKKVILAYSGGLDTSVAVSWVKETLEVEVVTLTVDVGGGSLREGVERRAISAGAARAYVIDARQRFVTDFCWPNLQANALYQGVYPLATALARPLIAQLLVEVAQREGADAVAHGCTGKGNDQVRFDVAVHALDPSLEVIAPMRIGMGLSRDQEIEYAEARGIQIPITRASPYSIDANLWGRSIETGVLEDPWTAPPADVYQWTVDPAAAPAVPAEVTISFAGGVPVALDGIPTDPVGIVDGLSELGGKHGVGRIDHVEDRLVGIKSREIYEAPAAVILHVAHRALEGLTLSKEQLRFDRLVADELAQATYDGLWFSALHRDLREYIRSTQRVVSGEVRLRLDRGSLAVVGRRSDLSLYDRALATYEAEDRFDHASAVGFIKIFGLPLVTEAARQGSAWAWTEPLVDRLPLTVADANDVKAPVS
ncbi:MAG TPA: argininosuccinate synthase [Candidatus Limnocylindrales bacterium]